MAVKIRMLRSRVTWTSQAGGRKKRKVGYVAEVVPARRRPRSRVSGAKRDHVSYVVEVPATGAGRAGAPVGKSELYWPLASLLRGMAGRLPRAYERERAKIRKRVTA